MDTNLALSLILLFGGASAFLHAEPRATRATGAALVLAALAFGWGAPDALAWQGFVGIAAVGALPLWLGIVTLMRLAIPARAAEEL